MVKVCEVCGDAFNARKANVKTCSPACKRELQRRVMDKLHGKVGRVRRLADKTCTVCGELFEPSSGNQKTCSYKCSKVLAEWREAERAAAQPEAVQLLPLHVAEGACRRLGMSYGEASAEAFNCGMTLSRYLVCRARREGIEILKEGEA